MNRLPESFGYWIGAALLLFWFVGAYNRLVRLRSTALQAYATLDAALLRQLDFVQSCAVNVLAAKLESPASPDVGVDRVAEADAAAYVSLSATTAQLSTLLGTVRSRPLDPAGIAALNTALHVMLNGWQRLHPEAVVSFEADGTLSRPGPLSGDDERPSPADIAPIAWPEPSPAAEIARGQFNVAVAQYNAAVGQFPAALVAWIMQMRRAAALH
jgi:hypothetical protein